MAGRKKQTLLDELTGITAEYAGRSYRELLDQAYQWASQEARRGHQAFGGIGALYAALGLLPDCEDVVLAAAHRALVKRFHPDIPGGDVQRMARVNAAYQEIRRLRGGGDDHAR